EPAKVRRESDRRIERTRPVPTGRFLASARDAVVGSCVEYAFPRLHVGARIVRREAWDRAVDQPRIAFASRFNAEAQPRHHAGTEVFEDDVRGIYQALGRGAVLAA